jgi:uncharacterized membrane protein
MHEEPESELSSSSIKPILIVVGALAGLSLLVCGGVAGYVALTTPSQTKGQVSDAAADEVPSPPDFFRKNMKEDALAKRIPLTEDPAHVRKIAATILKIDLPPEFEPIEASKEGNVTRAVFGKPTENAALLKMAILRMQTPGIDSSVPLDEPTSRQVLKAAENENGRTDTTLRVTRVKIEPSHRELTVLGQPVDFSFRQGKLVAGGKPVWKIWGAFGTMNEMTGLIILIPESEYDEEAIVRMIESIRPGDTDEPAAGEQSIAAPPELEKADKDDDPAADPD